MTTPRKDIEEYGKLLDPEKVRRFNAYLDDIFPSDTTGEHPFTRFSHAEIVGHATFGLGIVTGFKIHDTVREMEGLGIQFVQDGRMMEHRVFTPDESLELNPTGVVYQVRKHGDMTLEETLKMEEEE